jgi:hypothetical protein
VKQSIQDDLEKKMVFIGGPRQVGKSTLALDLLGAKGSNHPAYLNWDAPGVRQALIKVSSCIWELRPLNCRQVGGIFRLKTAVG